MCFPNERILDETMYLWDSTASRRHGTCFSAAPFSFFFFHQRFNQRSMLYFLFVVSGF